MEEVKKEMLEEQTEQAVEAEQTVEAGQAVEAPQAEPMTEEERKAAKRNFKRNALIMAAGFVLGYLIGRMIFVELRMLAYVCGMAMAGIVCALYIKK